MSKTIKLEEKVYHQLDALRGKRETFSEVVAKLLTTKEGADTMFGIWHGEGEGTLRRDSFGREIKTPH